MDSISNIFGCVCVSNECVCGSTESVCVVLMSVCVFRRRGHPYSSSPEGSEAPSGVCAEVRVPTTAIHVFVSIRVHTAFNFI